MSGANSQRAWMLNGQMEDNIHFGPGAANRRPSTPSLEDSTSPLEADATWSSRATSVEAERFTQNVCKGGCHQGFTLVPGVGLYVDAHQLVLDRSAALDMFKGLLVVLMVASNVILMMGSHTLTATSFASRMICNMAAAQCFTGFMMAFGYSCYRQYLREWPDPPKNLNRVRMKVLRTIAFPIVGAWVCNFSWCFLAARKENIPTLSLIWDVLAFQRVFGNGPNFLLGFSINLSVVYLLWRPITNFLNTLPPAAETMDSWYLEFRRDAVAVAIVLVPLAFTLIAVPDCSGYLRWARWLFVCQKQESATPILPALPHLLDFGVGVLVAAAWDRFISHLKPVEQGGPSGGLHVLPMAALRYWVLLVGFASMVLMLLFVPLGQVWIYTDLTNVQVSTPFGNLVRGQPGGPSAIWLLSTLWTVGAWAIVAGVIVTLRCTWLGTFLHWPMAWLEHLGANVLFYQVVADLFLAGISHGINGGNFQMDLLTSMLYTTIILAACRFFHFIAHASRK